MAEPIKLTTEGLLLNWLKEVGDSVKAGEVIAEIEADKATVEIEAPQDGVLVEIQAEIGEELEEGAVIGAIGSEDEVSDGDDAEDEDAAAPEPSENGQSEPTQDVSGNGAARTDTGRVKASPLARRIAEDKGFDIADIPGSGPGGRVTKSDVEEFQPGQAQPAPAPAPTRSGLPVGDPTWGKVPSGDLVEVEEISRMRRAIAEGTVLSFSNIPHFYVNVDIKIDALLALRKEINTELESDGIKVSVNDLMVRATALALRQYPNLNSHFYGDKVVRHKNVNIGIAVALPNNGLVSVVSRDADKTALSALAERHKAMFERAREGRIKPDDVKGGTFTISNLGPYGIDWFSAIISAPEAGILALGAGKKQPVVLEDNSIGVATIMSATLSVDHRVSDGAEGAEFMQALRTMVENPMRLLV
jgi:pyruvate dehydrogenase E2 component (dihydrolipoamide acetyltransferase)